MMSLVQIHETRTINEYPGARNFHRGNQAEPGLVKSATSPDTLSKLPQPSEITPSVQKAPNSFIASRPFCIILLTDVTIVLARLFRESGNDSEEIEGEKNAGKEDEDNWAGAVKLLERVWSCTRPFVASSLTAVFICFGQWCL
ncbi:hypothetical protein GH714_037094 [Hevea brasiliensis]|uniref:Uncharacterized protein n=1 Tax=Hevea brasiliensis TaxID=3981 RepID=A0A6A6MI61_HEVBR|nr:hypothetical protein GH714_037094 [Hevea brasiliensis]